MLLRSDVYDLNDEGRLIARTAATPEISLDSKYYKKVGEFTSRFPAAPSLRRATSFKVKGDWTFGSGVTVVGDVELPDEGQAQVIPDGTTLD